MWTPPAITHQPELDFSFQPGRLWFWMLADADPWPVMLQADDNDNSYLTGISANGQEWITTLEDTQTMTVCVVGEVALVADRTESSTGESTELLGYSTRDGSIVLQERLEGAQSLGCVGSYVLLFGWSGDDLSIARLDETTLKPVVVASLPDVVGTTTVDRGLLAWSASEALLVSLDGSWSVEHWAAGATTPGGDGDTPTVVGDTFVKIDGSVVGYGFDGTRRWTIEPQFGEVTALWSGGDDLLLVAGADGLELFEAVEGRADLIGTRPGAGRLGPASIIDGESFAAWYSGGTGSILRLGVDGFTELLTFDEQSEPDEDGATPPEQVTFVDAAVYVASTDRATDHVSQILRAHSLDDGAELWTVDVRLELDWVARWDVEPGFILLKYGYPLIPGQIDIYR